jgi:hypothetical protein
MASCSSKSGCVMVIVALQDSVDQARCLTLWYTVVAYCPKTVEVV